MESIGVLIDGGRTAGMAGSEQASMFAKTAPIWDKLSADVVRLWQDAAPESSFQALAEDLFQALGWSRLMDEVDSQRRVPIGAGKLMKPDIVIVSGGKDQFVVELKRPAIGHTPQQEDQICSYMLQLKLRFGLLVGERMLVYFDDPIDDEKPQQVAAIAFEAGSGSGAELLSLLSKDHWSQEAAAAYCARQLAQAQTAREIEKIVSELCSGAGAELAANALSQVLTERHGEEVAEAVLSEVRMGITRKQSLAHAAVADTWLKCDDELSKPLHSTASHRRAANTPRSIDPPTHCSEPVCWQGRSIETCRRSDEKFQDFVRRSLDFLFANDILSASELENLQSKAYSKRTLGLEHPLLVADRRDTVDGAGYSRYWTTVMFGRKYYACSQWWKPHMHIYEPKFAAWMRKVVLDAGGSEKPEE